ncbi:hypothetical protein [Cupriavidus nantongensis]|uniref:hypothetical protein n=1 Tax=Cupriavidus nantongensis TaxID=1796606 RepID=UPI000AC0D087|nr:hypothetical protein [Cupriavidus nantongensis]
MNRQRPTLAAANPTAWHRLLLLLAEQIADDALSLSESSPQPSAIENQVPACAH